MAEACLSNAAPSLELMLLHSRRSEIKKCRETCEECAWHNARAPVTPLRAVLSHYLRCLDPRC